MSKTHEEYVFEYFTLLAMYRCSTRYLAERANKVSMEQCKIDMEQAKNFRKYYHKRSERIEKMCKKNTGKNLYDGFVCCNGSVQRTKLKFREGVIEIERVLDVCCGSRMFYFDRDNPDVIFADVREVETTLCDGRTLLIKPDIKMDFRNMKYRDNTFKVIVFDPPHLINAGTGSWLAKKYGILPVDWPTYLEQGFNECMRVLEPNGLLVFKWNEEQIKLSDVLKVFDKKPLLGDQRGKTRWIIFMK